MTTWLVSFNKISIKDKQAAEYLNLMSLMSEKDIPRDFFHAAYDDETSEAGEGQKDETEWPPSEVDGVQVEKSIGILAAYAFITKTTEDSYDLHQLVSLSIWNWPEKEKVATTYATQVVMRLNIIFPAPDYENKDFWLRYLPHTRHILSSPVKHTGDAAKAKLLSHVAWAFQLLGNYRESEKYHEQALELNRSVFRNEHVDTLATRNNFGLALDRQGKYDEAEKVQRQTLELKEKVLGKEHPEALLTMENLALVFDRQGKYDEAEKMYRQTLELKEKVLGKEHPETLIAMDNLAGLPNRQGKYDGRRLD